MGGVGSGRHGDKLCTGDMLRLDVRHLQRVGRLTPSSIFLGSGHAMASRRAASTSAPNMGG